MNAKKEKIHGLIPYCLGSAGLTMSYTVISNLTYCLTESYGLAAAITGTIFLVSRLLDGVTDLIAGYIIDRTHTKWGKARPFDLVSIPLWLFVVLSFSVPDWSTTGKVIWVLLTYNLSQSVCNTLSNGAVPVRLKRSFREDQRVKVLSVGAVFAAVICLVTAVAMPILIDVLKDTPHCWTIISICFAVPGILMAIIQFVFLKELDEEDEVQKTEKISIWESIKALAHNPYLFISALAFLMLSLYNGTASSSSNYYFTYVVGSISLASIPSMLSIVGALCVGFLPAITKKFGNKGAVMLGFVLMGIFNSIKLLFPTNIAWLSICNVFALFGITVVGSMKNIINIDCMEYGYRKTGMKLEGMYSCINGFVDKAGLGLGSFVLGIIMELGGYDGTAAAQSASAILSIKFSFTLLPLICAAVGLFVMAYYDEKKIHQAEAVE